MILTPFEDQVSEAMTLGESLDHVETGTFPVILAIKF